MTVLFDYPFQPINSTAPSFNSTLGSSSVYALQSTGREWSLPTGRAVRVASKASTPYSILFGSSNVSPSTATSVLVPNGNAHVFAINNPAAQTYIGIASSTDVLVNITLGHGR